MKERAPREPRALGGGALGSISLLTNVCHARGWKMWDMQERIALFDAERFESLGPGYLALSLAGEAGELANAMKKLWRQDERIGARDGFDAIPADHKAGIADELADVVMLCVVLANHLGIDVDAELTRKLQLIDQRLQSGYYGGEAAARSDAETLSPRHPFGADQ